MSFLGIVLIGLRLYHRNEMNKQLSNASKVYSFERYAETVDKVERLLIEMSDVK